MSSSPTDTLPTLTPSGSRSGSRVGPKQASGHQRVEWVPGPPSPSEGTHSARPTPTGHPSGSNTRSCRVCGCTDWTACTGPNDYACWWIEPDLCSSCQDGS